MTDGIANFGEQSPTSQRMAAKRMTASRSLPKTLIAAFQRAWQLRTDSALPRVDVAWLHTKDVRPWANSLGFPFGQCGERRRVPPERNLSSFVPFGDRGRNVNVRMLPFDLHVRHRQPDDFRFGKIGV